jgi:hypothetical protein
VGQYHLAVNLDKHEYIHPHHLGDGLKLMEFGMSAGGTMSALAILLACSNGRGGGDLHVDESHPAFGRIGSWAGDRIAIVGDYAEEGDYPTKPGDASPAEVYDLCSDGTYTDLSADLCALIEADGLYKFRKADWGGIERTSIFEIGRAHV